MTTEGFTQVFDPAQEGVLLIDWRRIQQLGKGGTLVGAFLQPVVQESGVEFEIWIETPNGVAILVNRNGRPRIFKDLGRAYSLVKRELPQVGPVTINRERVETEREGDG